MEFPRKDNIVWGKTDKPLRFQVYDWFVPEADKSIKKIQADARKRGEPIEYPDETPEYEVLMFGCTDEGHSVCSKVTGFIPYFYVKVPDRFAKLTPLTGWINELYTYLSTGKYQDKRYNYQRSIIPYKLSSHLVSITEVHKKEFYGFTNNADFTFLKISVKSLALYNSLRFFLQRPPKEFLDRYKEPFTLYESNLDPFLRFIHVQNIQPCGWVELPANQYQLISNGCEDESYSRANFSVSVHHTKVKPYDCTKTAPILITSFDLECTSSHGDFPVAKKDYRKLAKDLYMVAQYEEYDMDMLIDAILAAYKEEIMMKNGSIISRLYTIQPIQEETVKKVFKKIGTELMDIMQKIKTMTESDNDSDNDDGVAEGRGAINKMRAIYENDMKILLDRLPKLQGDAIIQIGTTVHRYGSDEIIYRNIITLKSCNPIPGVEVQSYNSENDVLIAWKSLIQRLDPDILMGYNIFGFDIPYVWDRAEELFGTNHDYGVGFGRLSQRNCQMLEQKLASSALGENFMYYLDMDGIVSVDVYKVMMRDHKLDSYKLDFVAQEFLKDQKNDLSPNEIFEKYLGTSEDRKVIAEYCIQDCALVNRLFHKLKILENNAAMGNVCSVPLNYLFMRGQGIKIFSLVANECRKNNYAIPVLKGFQENEAVDEIGYEGAIVLDPKVGMYLEDYIVTLDFASLYPSSMIERNLSHDCYVNDDKYDNLPGIDYKSIAYDIYEGTGDQKKIVGQKICKFVQLPEGEKGIIPRILMMLLKQRKVTRKKIEYESLTHSDGTVYSGLIKETGDIFVVQDVEKGTQVNVNQKDIVNRKDTYNAFEKDVLDALQLAYKVTANSLYGQIGSRTSQIYLKDIAACTTATGRERIMHAKQFVETNYDCEVIYGDTDSIFCRFKVVDENGTKLKGKEGLAKAIKLGQAASAAINKILPAPQNLEYEKTFYPFIILSKKRYVGNLYEDDPNKKPKQKSMGIVLKRRDNAPLVKKIYGGIVDILLNEANLEKSVDFLKSELTKLVNHEYPLEDFIITKTLRSCYKDPTKIAHKVLADRMGARDPGNKPQVNDRIPYIYIQVPEGTEIKLQGDRIENPTYIRENNLKPDYSFYITNQLINPVSQIYELSLEQLCGYTYPPGYWEEAYEELKSSKLYAESHIRRANRIASLRIREVVELLFEPYIAKKIKKVKITKASTGSDSVIKQKKEKKVILPTYTLDKDAPTIVFDVTENKETKVYSASAEFYIRQQLIEETTITLPKKGTYNSKIKACPRLLQDVLKKYISGHQRLFDEHGLRLQIKDTRYRNNLHTAINVSTDLYSKREEASRVGDLEQVEKYNDMEKDLGLIQAIVKVKYEIV